MTDRRVFVVDCGQMPQSMQSFDSHLAGLLPVLGVTAAPRSIDIAAFEEVELTVNDVVLLTGNDVDIRDRAVSCATRCEAIGTPVVTALNIDQSTRDILRISGAMTLPMDIDAASLAAIVIGLLHRQAYVVQLHREVDVTRRVQGGLTGEIDKMHEELQLAAVVQRELLPRSLPTLLGVEVDALWRPAHYVSGDIFDVQQLDDDHLGVFVADAVGHGVPAALMTMVISRSLITKERSQRSEWILPPSEVMRRLNERLIQRQGTTTRFATGVYAVINCRDRTAVISGAGHPPVLQLKPTGETIEIESQGGLLGIFDDETYESVEIELDVNDRLIIHSDGFEQAFPDDESATARELKRPTHRYRQEFDALRAAHNTEGMIEHIAQRLDQQAGSLHQADDLTIVCVRSMALGEASHDTDAYSADIELVDSHQ